MRYQCDDWSNCGDEPDFPKWWCDIHQFPITDYGFECCPDCAEEQNPNLVAVLDDVDFLYVEDDSARKDIPLAKAAQAFLPANLTWLAEKGQLKTALEH